MLMNGSVTFVLSNPGPPEDHAHSRPDPLCEWLLKILTTIEDGHAQWPPIVHPTLIHDRAVSFRELAPPAL